MKKKRFVQKLKQSISGAMLKIIVDTETGVHYLSASGGMGLSGMTPLLDENGNIVIEKEAY